VFAAAAVDAAAVRGVRGRARQPNRIAATPATPTPLPVCPPARPASLFERERAPNNPDETTPNFDKRARRLVCKPHTHDQSTPRAGLTRATEHQQLLISS